MPSETIAKLLSILLGSPCPCHANSAVAPTQAATPRMPAYAGAISIESACDGIPSIITLSRTQIYHRGRAKCAYHPEAGSFGGAVSDPSNRAFDPDVTQAMSVAFAEICRALGVTGTDKAEREKIALLLIDIAGRGERDPDRLRDHVLRAAR